MKRVPLLFQLGMDNVMAIAVEVSQLKVALRLESCGRLLRLNELRNCMNELLGIK
jgi:hypothetical protein